jgi:hypothetical protein
MILELDTSASSEAAERFMEPFAVSVKTAARLEDAGVSTIWQRLARGEYDAVRDGNRTKILVESIKRRRASLPKFKPRERHIAIRRQARKVTA